MTAVQKAPEEMTPERFSEITLAIEKELGRFMVGQAELIRLTLIALIGGGHVLLEGVPGLGKTVLVRSLASVLDLDFARVQFTPDLMPADITGTHIVTEDDEGRRRFEFQPGPLFTNLLLADEINRATPKTQSALLEAMQERQVTVGDRTRPLPLPFFVLATQNPIELEGTYPLPEAQLDRFFFKLLVPFPDAGDLAEIARRTTGTEEADLQAVASGEDLAGMARLAREVPVAESVMDRAVAILLGPHPERPAAPDEVRPYVSGDDFRQIDWRAYARLERLMLRLYVAEEEACLNVVLDTSASMELGEPPKWQTSRRLAAALAFLGLEAMDRVQVGTLDGR